MIHDRAYLLSDGKRNDVLELWEVEQYGEDSFGDPGYVAVYGLLPAEWYALGIRLLARTTVECTRDVLADTIGADIAALADTAPGVSASVVVDPFAGSANTLYWIARRVGASRALAFELDERVCESTRRNLAIVSLGLGLAHVDYEAGLSRLRIANDELLIVFVAPPWGDALSATAGLDLSRTAPPVPHIIDFVARVFSGHKVLLAVQVYETVVRRSLAAVAARCDWSAVKTYDFDAPGHNHGLLLGTLGWRPGATAR